jgi:hypothetical protein
VTNPHMKNSVVTTASTTLLLEAGEPTVPERACILTIAISFSPRSSPDTIRTDCGRPSSAGLTRITSLPQYPHDFGVPMRVV